MKPTLKPRLGSRRIHLFFRADLQTAKENAESFPWVDEAIVRRLWPNRIVIQIVEREAAALLQRDETLFIMNANGEIISEFPSAAAASYAVLPKNYKTYSGFDAAMASPNIRHILESYLNIWPAVTHLTRHRSGRWDLYLASGAKIALPASEPAIRQALSVYEDFLREDPRRSATISAFDLRLPDRLTVTPRVNRLEETI